SEPIANLIGSAAAIAPPVWRNKLRRVRISFIRNSLHPSAHSPPKRRFSLVQPGSLRWCGGPRGAAESPLAAAEFPNRAGQVHGSEVRPHTPRKKQLGVSTFPEQEVA